MNKALIGLVVAGCALAQSAVEAMPLKAELVMSGGRSWKGQIQSRDGDWIVFSASTSGRPIRMGASTIQELIFDVELDADKIIELKDNREFARVIKAVEQVLEPFQEFNDIPSNLTKYNALLMEMHYLVGAYDESLAISSSISEDDRNPVLQKKSRIFRILSLIDSERTAEAEVLLAEYGWDKETSSQSPAEILYLNAKILASKGQFSMGMEYVAKVIAFNSQNPEWMQPAELLCAEIYTELGMYDSAEEVIRQIGMLYKDSVENDEAQVLKSRIEQLRAAQAMEETISTEEA